MKFTTFFAAAVLALSATAAAAQDSELLDNSPSSGAMAVDLVLIRPLSLVGTVIGVGLFVVQLPFALLQGEAPAEPARKLVVQPFKFTFTRPLGRTDYAH